MSNNSRSRRNQHITVHANDVLNGRGVKIAQHPGNLRFRSLVKGKYDDCYCEKFSSSEKKALAREIINHISQKLNPPGRFLKRHGEDGPWIELSKSEVEKKTKQALRDCNRGDRTGYAQQVAVPQDVRTADFERKQSGLSLQEHARRQLGKETKRAKTKAAKCSNNNHKTPPTSGAASRSSRRWKQGTSTTSKAFGSVPDVHIIQQRMQESMDLTYKPSMNPVLSEPSSTSGWLPVASTATPATRPYMDPAPVTQTPNPSNPSFFQGDGQDHHQEYQLGQSGSQAAAINPHPDLSEYPDDYARRDTFENHQPISQALDSVARDFTSPVLRSPIVTQSCAMPHVFEIDNEPFLDDLYPGHHPRQNLFHDPLDSLAASADESLNRSDEDFMLALGNNSEDNIDLAI
mmetsp:Transcript_10910/g.26214  ORF Transcript_10910/g.26214 Transcript_10910/m.26214 type:complete len:404 (-) Transcript_10910:416-1627(-)